MTPDPFATTAPLIAASILSADFSKLASEINDVGGSEAGGGERRGGVDFLHLDVMDGHAVPNISFGPPIIETIRPVTNCYFDAHLMITDPLRYAPAMVEAGANNVTFHVEQVPDPAAAAREIKKLGCHVGITLNPATGVEAVFPALDHVEVVLVMSVVPGFSGQKFMPEVLAKCETIKKRLGPHQRLEIDGGINADTIRRARDAGVDWFVVASAIFGKPDRAAAIAELRERLEK